MTCLVFDCLRFICVFSCNFLLAIKPFLVRDNIIDRVCLYWVDINASTFIWFCIIFPHSHITISYTYCRSTSVGIKARITDLYTVILRSGRKVYLGTSFEFWDPSLYRNPISVILLTNKVVSKKKKNTIKTPWQS